MRHAERIAENAGPKKSPKIAIWAPSHNFVGLYLRNQGTYFKMAAAANLNYGNIKILTDTRVNGVKLHDHR